jgi:hypothetical protein
VETLAERVRAWSVRRQRLGGEAAPDLATALDDVVAVYGSHPSGPLSLAARVRRFDAAEYRGLEEDRAAVRMPAMRTSVHLVPVRSAPWVFAATHRDLRSQAWRLRNAGVDQAGYAVLRDRVVAAAREPLTLAEVRERAGLPAEGAAGLLHAMGQEGVVLRVGAVSLRSSVGRYVATDAWLGAAFTPEGREAALTTLADRYLRAFGPARAEDLAWWAGGPRSWVPAALARLDLVDLGGGLLLPADLHDAFRACVPPDPDVVDVVPVWDAYVMGYAPDGRARLADGPHVDRCYDEVGNGLGVVLSGGRAVAAWGSRFRGRVMEVDLDPFARLPARTRRAVEGRFDEVARLLGAAEAAVRAVDGPLKPVGGKGNRRPIS